jgi:hypothetical protein
LGYFTFGSAEQVSLDVGTFFNCIVLAEAVLERTTAINTQMKQGVNGTSLKQYARQYLRLTCIGKGIGKSHSRTDTVAGREL